MCAITILVSEVWEHPWKKTMRISPMLALHVNTTVTFRYELRTTAPPNTHGFHVRLNGLIQFATCPLSHVNVLQRCHCTCTYVESERSTDIIMHAFISISTHITWAKRTHIESQVLHLQFVLPQRIANVPFFVLLSSWPLRDILHPHFFPVRRVVRFLNHFSLLLRRHLAKLARLQCIRRSNASPSVPVSCLQRTLSTEFWSRVTKWSLVSIWYELIQTTNEGDHNHG